MENILLYFTLFIACTFILLQKNILVITQIIIQDIKMSVFSVTNNSKFDSKKKLYLIYYGLAEKSSLKAGEKSRGIYIAN